MMFLIFTFLLSICLVNFNVKSDSVSSPRNLYVGGNGLGNYTSIQKAINDASDGDIIYVYPGTYYENLNIDKEVKLIGKNRQTTIIDGQERGETIKNTVHLSHLAIRDFTIRNGIYGIGLYSCDNAIIYDTIISGNRYAGIWMDSSSECIIKENIIQNNPNGIWIDHHSNYNIIEGNTILNNHQGIYISSSYKNDITNNNFVRNHQHAFFENASDNIWSENYWDDWIGLKHNFLKKLPKRITGKKKKMISFDFDWNPSEKLYIFYNSKLYVGGEDKKNYTTIQDAIDNANDGDVIYVYKGIYYENIVVNKSITLVGESKKSTIIDGKNIGSVVKITASEVKISNFTIRNGSYGITLLYSNLDIIHDNHIVGNRYDGIWLDSSYSNLVYNNMIRKHRYNAILLVESNNNMIDRDDIQENGYGIGIINSFNNTICYNNFIDNRKDAYFVSSYGTTWSKNYWDRWIDLKCKFLIFLPKIILGKSTEKIWKFVNFDWYPSKEPYIIN